MRKKFYFATLVIAALSFTGCANDEYVGDQQKLGEQNGAIAFSTKSTNTVRADNWTGAKAAGKLNNKFWVYGWKTGGNSTTPLVFDNYKVEYRIPTTYPSNTEVWEYVGITIPGASQSQTQTIKYWDYSADKYEFEAYSYKSSEGSVTRNGKALEAGSYEVKKLSETEYANLYFAQKETKLKPATGTKYDDVQLKFKSVLSKIRVGFYETIPGYSVKIDGFYPPQSGETPNDFVNASNTESKNFFAWCPNKAANTAHPFVVTYVTDNDVDPDVTTPTVTKVANDANSDYIEITNNESYKLDAQLTLGTNLRDQGKIGETYSAVTWDNIDGESNPIYTYFIPQNDNALWNNTEANSKVKSMRIKVDYTLTSTDGSKEEIKVTGATAIVPAEYLKWKPNTAYSYVFKISDQTNGTTGTPSTPGDLAGLYPITFDAVVEDMAEYKDHLTTVSDLSITATQEGPFADANKAVFKIDQPINVKVMYNNGDITSAIGSSKDDADKLEAAFVNSYKYDKSPEQNLTDNNGSYDQPDFANNVITLGSQTSAGYWIVKVTYTADGKDITKYAVLKVGTVPTPPSQAGGQG